MQSNMPACWHSGRRYYWLMDDTRRELTDSIEAAYRFGDHGPASAPFIRTELIVRDPDFRSLRFPCRPLS
jgi:hypothetical protein